VILESTAALREGSRAECDPHCELFPESRKRLRRLAHRGVRQEWGSVKPIFSTTLVRDGGSKETLIGVTPLESLPGIVFRRSTMERKATPEGRACQPSLRTSVPDRGFEARVWLG